MHSIASVERSILVMGGVSRMYSSSWTEWGSEHWDGKGVILSSGRLPKVVYSEEAYSDNPGA